MIPVRLACVKHAASVRPEPGSNSDVQSFIHLSPSAQPLAKAALLLDETWRFSLRNLTVLFALSLLSLYRFQGSRCRGFP